MSGRKMKMCSAYGDALVSTDPNIRDCSDGAKWQDKSTRAG
jgi:hypothetical protein